MGGGERCERWNAPRVAQLRDSFCRVASLNATTQANTRGSWGE